MTNSVKEINMSLRSHFLIYRLFILLGSLALFLPGFTGNVTFAAASVQLVQVHSQTPSIPGDVPVDCPDAPILDASAGPYLHFCSPKFAGDVAGPFGSHIVVFGGNFPSLPKAMYLTLNKDATQSCTPGPGCFFLTISPGSFTRIAQDQFVFKFNWTFPISAALPPEDFYLVAIYNKARHEAPAGVVTRFAFTLLSSEPPCITVSDKKIAENTPQFTVGGTPIAGPAPVGCASPQNIFRAGSTIFIQGYNWLPGGQNQQSVVVSATCITLSACSRQALFTTTFTAFPDSSGFFQQQVFLPPGLAGNYQITASNEVQPVTTPGGATNSIASGALTFGGQHDNMMLTLSVSNSGSGSLADPLLRRVIPSGVISLLALVLALFSFVMSRSARRRISTAPSGAPRPTQVYYYTRNEPKAPLTVRAEMEAAPLEKMQSQPGRIEQARLWLKKGNFTPAIEMAKEAQCSNREMWQPLLEAIAEVPAEAIPSHLLETAASTLERAINEQVRDNALKLHAEAFIAYRLLLNKADRDTVEAADLWYNLGIIYTNFPCASLETYTANLEAAIACFQVAHQTYNSRGRFEACAATLHNLGNIYSNSNMPGRDRQANLEVAIAYYKDALGFYTPEEHPIPQSLTNEYLGHAYSMLPGEGRKRQENLPNAETY